MKFYEFNQNNSRGYIFEDSLLGIGDYVYIQANEESEANKIAESIGLFSLPYCDCCGERFYEVYGSILLDSTHIFTTRSKLSIYIHYKNGEKESLNIDCTSGELEQYCSYTFNIKDKTFLIDED